MNLKRLIRLKAVLLMGAALAGCNALPEPQVREAATTPSARVGAAVASIGVCDAQLNEAALAAAGWTKTFEDNFDGDLSKWNIWNGGAYNNELQLYQAANLAVGSSTLSIAAKRETVTGPTLPASSTPKTFSFTSGRIECKTNVSASTKTPKVRMIARIKLPAGYGMWPAFWSYGDSWPTNGEIDFLEARGNEPFVYSTNYFYGRRAGQPLAGNFVSQITSSVSLTDCWHVYEAIWEKNALTFLLDGQVVDTKTGGYVSNLFGKTERITLNLAVGGDFFGNPPASSIVTGTMLVDYVKVFVSK
ncbi:glycoside hydrolase family 16 protein [Spirosoma aerophilum]